MEGFLSLANPKSVLMSLEARAIITFRFRRRISKLSQRTKLRKMFPQPQSRKPLPRRFFLFQEAKRLLDCYSIHKYSLPRGPRSFKQIWKLDREKHRFLECWLRWCEPCNVSPFDVRFLGNDGFGDGTWQFGILLFGLTISLFSKIKNKVILGSSVLGWWRVFCQHRFSFFVFFKKVKLLLNIFVASLILQLKWCNILRVVFS